MKRIATFVVTAILALAVLSGCPNKKKEGPPTQQQQKQMQDMQKQMQKQMKQKGGG